MAEKQLEGADGKDNGGRTPTTERENSEHGSGVSTATLSPIRSDDDEILELGFKKVKLDDTLGMDEGETTEIVEETDEDMFESFGQEFTPSLPMFKKPEAPRAAVSTPVKSKEQLEATPGSSKDSPSDSGVSYQEDEAIPAELRNAVIELLTSKQYTEIDPSWLTTFGGMTIGSSVKAWFGDLVTKAIKRITDGKEKVQAFVTRIESDTEQASELGAINSEGDLEQWKNFSKVVHRKRLTKIRENEKGEAARKKEEKKKLKEDIVREKAKQEAIRRDLDAEAKKVRNTKKGEQAKSERVVVLAAAKEKMDSEEKDKVGEASGSGLTSKMEADQDSSLESETDVSDCTKLCWKNAKSKFKYFKPTNIQDCKKNKSHYTAPPPVYSDGESDDEEWIRDSNTNPSSMSMYYDFVNKVLDIKREKDNEYYSREQRSKLKWAVSYWSPTTECPFSSCATGPISEHSEPKLWSTKSRYMRHIYEMHLHHHGQYECRSKDLKTSRKCVNGYVTSRRSNMIRHLHLVHANSLMIARDRVVSLNAQLQETFDPENLTEETEAFGETGGGKLYAAYQITYVEGRLHLDGEKFALMKKWRGDRVGKRPATTEPKYGKSKKQKKVESSDSARKSVLETVQPVKSGATFVATTAAWGSTPAVAASAEVKMMDEFPDFDLNPGPESQSLTPGGKSKDKSKEKKPKPVATPPKPLPEGALVVKRESDPFFRKEDRVSFEIQQGEVTNWQRRFVSATRDFMRIVTDSTLVSVAEIHYKEKTVLEQEANENLASKVSNADDREREAQMNIEYLEKEIALERKTSDRMRMRFERATKNTFEDWDGTSHQLRKWLDEADQKMEG